LAAHVKWQQPLNKHYGKQTLFLKKNAQLQDDYARLTQFGHANGKDVYLFLRPLGLAGSIRFRSEKVTKNLTSFEEILADALDDNDKRFVACIGAGGERWGPGQIHFAEDWEKNIIPFFKSAIVIISMPGYTPGCIQESLLIRQTPRLLQKTVFVIPPLSCFYSPSGGNSADADLAKSYGKAITLHRDQIGLNFPDPEPDTGYFLNMDYKTGKIRNLRKWKQVEVRTRSRATGGIVRIEKFPSLDTDHILAAIHMTLKNRGL